MQWAGEPLNVVLLNDPEGGVNFFTRLDRLGERQRAVKKVYLMCLALGYRGRYSELDPAQQAAQIGEIRQRLLRTIQQPLERAGTLFPEAYEPAEPLDVPAPPPSRTWLLAAAGTFAAAFLIWLALLLAARSGSLPAQKGLEPYLESAPGRVERNLRTERPPEPVPQESSFDEEASQ
jgi:type VI secretion system protein ImpK